MTPTSATAATDTMPKNPMHQNLQGPVGPALIPDEHLGREHASALQVK